MLYSTVRAQLIYPTHNMVQDVAGRGGMCMQCAGLVHGTCVRMSLLEPPDPDSLVDVASWHENPLLASTNPAVADCLY
jgi:hypothetical protein